MNIEFFSNGFKEILMSEGMKNLIQDETEKIQSKANNRLSEESEGFKTKVYQGNYGGGRWVGKVSTSDYQSMIAESENKILSEAVK